MVVVKQEVKKIYRRDTLALILTHGDLHHGGEHIELYASKTYCVLMREGDSDYCFDDGPTGELVGGEEDENLPEEIRAIASRGIMGPDDI